MLTADGNIGASATSLLDVVDKSWKGWKAADEESSDCTPVGAKLGRVAVNAVEVVHVGDGHFAASNDVVAAHMLTTLRWDAQSAGCHLLSNENRSHWAQEDGVARQESKELGGRSEDLPRHECPAANDRGEDLSTANVDVLWTEGHEIVGGRDGVGRNVDTERDDDQTDGSESGRSTTSVRSSRAPVRDDINGVP